MKALVQNAGRWILIGIILLGLVACGDESRSNESIQTTADGSSFSGSMPGELNESASAGKLYVALTDAVDPNLKEVVISIKEIRAVPKNSEESENTELPLIKTFNPSLEVNVLDLAYQQSSLGDANIPSGTYSQIRLILDANEDDQLPVNYVRFNDDPNAERISLKTPSAQSSGLKIRGDFSVHEDVASTIVLDFDPSRAIHRAGSNKWMFKPNGIRLVEVKEVLPEYGAITGTVLFRERVVDSALVSVVPEGELEPVSQGLVNPEDGSFRALLPEGRYVIRVEAAGFNPYFSEPEYYDVFVGEDTEAGTIQPTAMALLQCVELAWDDGAPGCRYYSTPKYAYLGNLIADRRDETTTLTSSLGCYISAVYNSNPAIYHMHSDGSVIYEEGAACTPEPEPVPDWF